MYKWRQRKIRKLWHPSLHFWLKFWMIRFEDFRRRPPQRSLGGIKKSGAERCEDWCTSAYRVSAQSDEYCGCESIRGFQEARHTAPPVRKSKNPAVSDCADRPILLGHLGEIINNLDLIKDLMTEKEHVRLHHAAFVEIRSPKFPNLDLCCQYPPPPSQGSRNWSRGNSRRSAVREAMSDTNSSV